MMIDGEKLKRIHAALGYWSLIDFLAQDSLPDTDTFARVYCGKNQTNKDRAPISVSHNLEHDLDEDAEMMACDFVKSNIDDACRKRINILNKKHPRTTKETEDLKHLKDTVANGTFPQIATIDIFLGIIPKEPVIAALEEKLAPSMPTPRERQEIETDDLVSALVHLNGSGIITGLEISPAIWLLSHNSSDVDTLYDAFEKEVKAQSNNIIDRLGRTPATFNDLRAIVAELLPSTLLEHIDAFQDEHPAYKCKSGCRPLCRSIVSYQAFDDLNREPTAVSLHSSFYSEDISAVMKTIESTTQKNGGDPESLIHGQLKLAISYLEGGLEDNDGSDPHRLDIQSPSEGVSSFYRQVLSLNHTPLGRWPSKYNLSLMQQVAVNLAAGRGLEQDVTATDVPTPDVMSVNGPPGTGKTTLLKDIIAANIVEKARLLSDYESPDDAFYEIKGVDKYDRYANHAYRLEDPRIADLGIIVCSSNNTAVENISEELPQGIALLGGLEDEKKDPHHERAMFRGDTEDTQNLFEIEWKIKRRDGGSRRSEEPDVIPDLYFSHIACEQFDTPKKAGTPLDMLISARLGRKNNIDRFRETSLEELIFAHDSGMRRKHIERFRLSSQAFREQYETVKSLMERYGKTQDEILRQRTSIEIARLQLDHAESKFNEAARVNEDAKCKLSCAFSSSIQRLTSNVDNIDRLAQVNDIQALQKLEDELRGELACYTGELNSLNGRLKSARQAYESTTGLFSGLKKNKLEREMRETEKELTIFLERNAASEHLARFKSEISSELKELESFTQAARETERSLIEAEANLKLAKARCADRQNELARSLSSCPYEITPGLIDSITGKDLDQSKLHDAHLFTPAASVPYENRLRCERDKLFLRALQVTRDFILSSKRMASNFRLLNAYWGAVVEKADGTGRGKINFSDNDAPQIVPALFQTLSILTPVISTTFASAGRLFRDIPITAGGHAPLGLCIIDEAGQAVPQAAVGILARCNKALVVGDPYQIEPVVNSEVKLYTELLGKDIDFPFKSCTSSVQTLADAANPIGHCRINNNGRKEWIGCPLVVHRRCVSPMFEISNEISYGNSMLNETAKLDPKRDNEKLESFYLPSSQWINITGHENGNKDHYVTAQGKRAKEIVLSAFAKRPEDTNVPSLYIISPFSTVAQGMCKALEGCRPDSVDEKTWNTFLKNNIGTVHKFQGKEAQEVIFMLGCDSSASGAVRWVNSNIVNVAASRAKQRLYVIADFNVWKQNNYVCTMKRIIDTAWVDLWNDSLAHGGKGIEEVRRSIPHLESLPTSDLAAAEADNKDAHEKGAKQGEAQGSGIEGACFDTSSFLESMRPHITQLVLSQSVCNRFGFEDEKALNAEFSTCPNADSSIPNPVLANIKMGMFLYDLFDIDRRSTEGDQEDWSFCAIMFCRAAELLLRRELLPALKAINPALQVTGRQTIADMQELGLGQYHHALCKTGTEVIRGMAAGYQCGSGIEIAESIVAGATPREPAWWKAFGSNLGKLAIIRNEFCHAGRSTAPDIKKLLARLFNSHVKPEEQGAHVALLREGRTLEIAKEGIGSKDFSYTIQKLESASPERSIKAATGSNEEEYLSLSSWKAKLNNSGELDSYPGLSAGAPAINKALEVAEYITKPPRVFTEKGRRLLDVKEDDAVDASGRPFKNLLYSHEALLETLKIYLNYQRSK